MRRIYRRFLRPAVFTVRFFTEADMLVYAANAALFFEIAAFPLVILLLSVIRFFPMLDPEYVRSALLELFPAVPEISSAVSGILKELERESTAAVTWISAFTALFSASSGLCAVIKGLVRLEAVRKTNWVRYRVYAVLYTLSLLILTLLTLGTQLALKIVVSLLNSRLYLPSLESFYESIEPGLKYFPFLTMLVSFLIALSVYCFPLGEKFRIREKVPGAVFAAVVWFLSSKVFAFVLGRFWKPSVVYGSLTAIILIAYWGYIIMAVLFLGAALNRALKKQRELLAEEAGSLSRS